MLNAVHHKTASLLIGFCLYAAPTAAWAESESDDDSEEDASAKIVVTETENVSEEKQQKSINKVLSCAVSVAD